MFGSSSTSLARSVFASSAASTSKRCLSSTSTTLASRKVLVELLQDYPKLGRIHDRVLVAPGFARHTLVPPRIARLVPFYRKYKIGPLKNKKSDLTPKNDPSLRITAPTKSTPRPVPQETTPELLAALSGLPAELTFPLRTVEGSSTLHGSLTLYDIQTRLISSYGFKDGDVDINWIQEDGLVDNRMKSLGRKGVYVKVKGRGEEERQVDIVVERLSAKHHLEGEGGEVNEL